MDQNQLLVVLYGMTGSGKTTLYNRITQSTEKALPGGLSNTLAIYLKQAAFEETSFFVYDTPGLGVYEEKQKHAAAVIAALTQYPVNRILMTIKFDRISNMLSFFKLIIGPISRYKYLITLVVTHWDSSVNPTEDQKQIEQTFKIQNINSFIYTSIKEDKITTCQNILEIIKFQQPIQIIFSDMEYIIQFDLMESDAKEQGDIERRKAEILQKAKKRFEAIKLYVGDKQTQIPTVQSQNFNYLLIITFGITLTLNQSEQEFCEILNELAIESMKIAKECIVEIEKQYISECAEQNDLQEAKFFSKNILYKKALQEELDTILDCITSQIIKIKGHCFNSIRSCPYCQQIWMKVQGCDGPTICGELPTQDEMIYQQKNVKWLIEWQGEQFEVKRNNQQDAVGNEIKYIRFDRYKNLQNVITQQRKKIGCGNIIIWNQMPQLSFKEVEELLDPGFFKFLCQEDKAMTSKLKISLDSVLENFKKKIEMEKKNMIYRK